MRSVATVLLVSCLLACADQVQLAKLEMDASVLRDYPLQYKNLQSYPGNIVCGRYSTSRTARGDTFRAFIYREKKVNINPTTLDLGIFCSEDSARNFFMITGIDVAHCKENALARVLADFSAIEGALIAYEIDNGAVPRHRQGLAALIRRSSSPPVPRRFRPGGYIVEIPTDPWDTPYHYKGPVFGGSKGQYALKTLGADKTAGGTGENADIDSQYLKYIDHIGGCSYRS